MSDHRTLVAFQKADALAISVYKLSKAFSKEELYGITSQIRRAAVSVPSNIVEGCARGSTPELMRFLSIALGSCRELQYQLSLVIKVDIVAVSHVEDCRYAIEKSEEVCRLLSALRSSLKTQNS